MYRFLFQQYFLTHHFIAPNFMESHLYQVFDTFIEDTMGIYLVLAVFQITNILFAYFSQKCIRTNTALLQKGRRTYYSSKKRAQTHSQQDQKYHPTSRQNIFNNFISQITSSNNPTPFNSQYSPLFLPKSNFKLIFHKKSWNVFITYLFYYSSHSIIFNSMPKRPQKGKANSDEQSEQLQDIMAWGKRKDNYYQDSSNEYSELEEEEQEAKKIYQNQLEQLDNQDLYEMPQNNQDHSDSQHQDEDLHLQNLISHDYLTKQIKKTAKLGLQISEFSDTKARALLQTHVQAYLMALIGLRQLKIPFVEHHPLVGISLQLKQDINKLKHLLASSTQNNSQNQAEDYEQEDYQNDEQPQFDEQAQEDDSAQNQGEMDDQIEEGLKIYQKLQEKQAVQKKAKKESKKAQRQTTKKPAFLEVKQNEGRLASEQILKNKGLMKKRKKIDRNGRVKLRRKFDKATSKRRAYGHFIRQNPGRNYQGEANIKYGRIASTKLK